MMNDSVENKQNGNEDAIKEKAQNRIYIPVQEYENLNLSKQNPEDSNQRNQKQIKKNQTDKIAQKNRKQRSQIEMIKVEQIFGYRYFSSDKLNPILWLFIISDFSSDENLNEQQLIKKIYKLPDNGLYRLPLCKNIEQAREFFNIKNANFNIIIDIKSIQLFKKYKYSNHEEVFSKIQSVYIYNNNDQYNYLNKLQLKNKIESKVKTSVFSNFIQIIKLAQIDVNNATQFKNVTLYLEGQNQQIIQVQALDFPETKNKYKLPGMTKIEKNNFAEYAYKRTLMFLAIKLQDSNEKQKLLKLFENFIRRKYIIKKSEQKNSEDQVKALKYKSKIQQQQIKKQKQDKIKQQLDNLQQYLKIANQYIQLSKNCQTNKSKLREIYVKVINFYVKETFYYKILNNLLRFFKNIHEFKLVWFAFHLQYKAIKFLYDEEYNQPNEPKRMIVYRGTPIKESQFKNIQKGDFLHTQYFTSTSQNLSVARQKYVKDPQEDCLMIFHLKKLIYLTQQDKLDYQLHDHGYIHVQRYLLPQNKKYHKQQQILLSPLNIYKVRDKRQQNKDINIDEKIRIIELENVSALELEGRYFKGEIFKDEIDKKNGQRQVIERKYQKKNNQQVNRISENKKSQMRMEEVQQENEEQPGQKKIQNNNIISNTQQDMIANNKNRKITKNIKLQPLTSKNPPQTIITNYLFTQSRLKQIKDDGDIYIYLKQYQKALQYYIQSYAKNHKQETQSIFTNIRNMLKSNQQHLLDPKNLLKSSNVKNNLYCLQKILQIYSQKGKLNNFQTILQSTLNTYDKETIKMLQKQIKDKKSNNIEKIQNTDEIINGIIQESEIKLKLSTNEDYFSQLMALTHNINFCENQNQWKQAVRWLLKRAKLYWKVGKMDLCENDLQKSLKLFQQNTQPKDENGCLNFLICLTSLCNKKQSDSNMIKQPNQEQKNNNQNNKNISQSLQMTSNVIYPGRNQNRQAQRQINSSSIQAQSKKKQLEQTVLLADIISYTQQYYSITQNSKKSRQFEQMITKKYQTRLQSLLEHQLSQYKMFLKDNNISQQVNLLIPITKIAIMVKKFKKIDPNIRTKEQQNIVNVIQQIIEKIGKQNSFYQQLSEYYLIQGLYHKKYIERQFKHKESNEPNELKSRINNARRNFDIQKYKTNLSSVLKSLQKSLQNIILHKKNTQNHPDIFQIKIQIAEINYEHRNFKQGQKMVQSILNSQQGQVHSLGAKSALLAAKIYIEKGQIKKAYDFVNMAENILRIALLKLKDNPFYESIYKSSPLYMQIQLWRCKLQNRLGRRENSFEKISMLLNTVQKALSNPETLPFYPTIYQQKGNILYHLNMLEHFQAFYDKAIQIRTLQGSKMYLNGITYCSKAQHQAHYNQMRQQSLQSLTKAFEIFNRYDDNHPYLWYFFSIDSLLSRQSQKYDQATKKLQKSIQIFEITKQIADLNQQQLEENICYIKLKQKKADLIIQSTLKTNLNQFQLLFTQIRTSKPQNISSMKIPSLSTEIQSKQNLFQKYQKITNSFMKFKQGSTIISKLNPQIRSSTKINYEPSLNNLKKAESELNNLQKTIQRAVENCEYKEAQFNQKVKMLQKIKQEQNAIKYMRTNFSQMSQIKQHKQQKQYPNMTNNRQSSTYDQTQIKLLVQSNSDVNLYQSNSKANLPNKSISNSTRYNKYKNNKNYSQQKEKQHQQHNNPSINQINQNQQNKLSEYNASNLSQNQRYSMDFQVQQ